MGRAAERMKLNLGCGPFKAQGWVNVDLEPGFDPDVVAPIHDLPVDDGTASHVYLGHVLEHLPWASLGTVLAEVRRVMVPGGSLGVVGPDVRLAHDRQMDWSQFVTLAESHHSYDFNATVGHDGGRHHWNCHAARVVDLLSDHGFAEVTRWTIETMPGTWPITSRAWWQCAIEARRPVS